MINQIKLNKIDLPIAIISNIQIEGVGSRNNIWESSKGDITFSIALKINSLPKDLSLSSSSIYFAYILKEKLQEYISYLWLKWPNDLYIENKKIGGIITNIIGNNIIIGAGINIKNIKYTNINISILPSFLLDIFILELEKFPLWIDIYNKYKLEFQKSKIFYSNIKGEYISLKNAILEKDGSIMLNGKNFFSLR